MAIFEIGKGYGYDEEAGAVHEWWRLGFVLAGANRPAAWNRPAEDWQVDDAKGLVELLTTRLQLESPAWRQLTDEPVFHPGRSAQLDGPARAINGRVGELHPALVAELDLRAEHIVIGELALPGLAGGRPPRDSDAARPALPGRRAGPGRRR